MHKHILKIWFVGILFISCSRNISKGSIPTYKIRLQGRIEYYDSLQKANLPVSWATIKFSNLGSYTNELGEFILATTSYSERKKYILEISANGLTTKKINLNTFKNKINKDSTVDLGIIILSN